MGGASAAMFWLLVILAMVVVLFVVATLVRRHFYSDRPPATGSPFTLGELRELHRQKKITQEEYDRLKAQLIGRLGPGNSSNPSSPSSD